MLRDKFKGAILGCLLGDAFGSDFEGMNPDRVMFYIGNLSKRMIRRYTDDTDMTLALAESLIQSKRIDPADISDQFRLLCDLTRGYGMGTIQAIIALRAGVPWHQVAKTTFKEGSYGNGAAMRVSPVGVFYHHDLETLREAAIQQANITHAHPLGQWGAVMQATAVGLAVIQDPNECLNEDMIIRVREVLWQGPIEYVKALNQIEQILSRRVKPKSQEIVEWFGNGVAALYSVPSACYVALTYSPNFCEAIRVAISLGGDTDTIAGMVGAIVGAHIGEKRLPVEWIEQLEDGPRGYAFAKDLANRLFETWWEVHRMASPNSIKV